MRILSALPLIAGCHLVFPLDDQPAGQPNVAFITSRTTDGNLGGLAGADQLCQEAAERGELPPNTYVAWLSDAETNAIDRLGNARGWVRTDDQPVADFPDELVTRGPRVPIAKTELEDDVRASSNVWTGTFANGNKEVADRRCGEWMSATTAEVGRVGDPEIGGGQFTAAATADCSSAQRLYCFGIDLANPVADRAPEGPLFFVSSTRWSANDVDLADEICANEASVAELPGSFAAVLARLNEPFAARFDPVTEFYRVDGVSLGPLLTSGTPNTFPFLTASGVVTDGFNDVWTGGRTQGTAETTCNDWTGAGTGTVGFRHVATANMFVATSNAPCNEDAFIYCAQTDD